MRRFRPDYFVELRNPDCVSGNQRQVECRGIMLGVVEAVRIDKMSVLRAELLRPFVHHFDEFLLRACDVLRGANGGVVARPEQKSVQQALQGQFLPRLEVQRTEADFARPSGNLDDVVEVTVFEGEDGSHYLRGARRWTSCAAPLLIEHRPGHRINEYHGLPSRCRRGRSGRHSRCRRQARHRDPKSDS